MARTTIAARLVAIRDLVELLDAELPAIRFGAPGDEMPTFVAALGLARANRLLQAMLLMNDSDLRDVAALPLRPLFEVWLISLYSFLGGEKALDELQGAHHKQISKIPSAVLRRMIERVESQTIDAKPIGWEQLSRKVGKLAEANGDTGAAARMQGFYDMVYRGESLASIHGGIGTVGGHALERSGRLVLRTKRADAKSATRVLITGGALVAILASHVLNAYELAPGDEFDSIARVIMREPGRR
jgi:hypothetical protein